MRNMKYSKIYKKSAKAFKGRRHVFVNVWRRGREREHAPRGRGHSARRARHHTPRDYARPSARHRRSGHTLELSSIDINFDVTTTQ